jgi:hypothetical protein
MNWAMLIPVIIEDGLPWAYKLWQLWTTKANDAPTEAEWDELRALYDQTPNLAAAITAAALKAGLPLTDPTVKVLLEMAKA